jgi:hypothetical protein
MKTHLSTRRDFLRATAALAASPLALSARAAAPGSPRARLKVAAVCTEFRYRGHAHVILENFLAPYLFNGERVDPEDEFEIASLYLDQVPPDDMGRPVAKDRGIPVFDTIGGALTLGGDALAVDAVLAIGEHGEYPVNAKGQREYPRKRFFDEILAVFRASGKVAPVFNDKHLSYRWDWAKAMYDEAKALGVPFMAGSSVPLAERRPPMEVPPDAAIREAVSIHGGPVESYDFHGLEVLQAMVEARRGGESGVRRVRFLEGDALWKAAETGDWSPAMADAALAAEIGPGHPTLRELVRRAPFDSQPPHGILLDYDDGLKAAVLRVGSSGTRWDFACRVEGRDEPLATSHYVGPWQNRNLFKALAHAIQAHFRDRRAPYPVERTLLTTGVLDAAMDSRIDGGRAVETPQFAVAYEPRDYRAFREMGATWRIVTEDTPEPKGIDPTGGSRPRAKPGDDGGR